ncbi:3-hydroxyisobutyryl-CoA hydrolase [Vandammella animalimorsus]|uniref:3-hydroxyisobutyryl-CoA hydrolase n=1 Tax=Vandammella animalimorsus TaxID=2029117 RepID=A0A2A2ACX3_9BURK|nr:enoyl-CoA hydratase/isomerase family protein [Vandammella animalimorsus]PAT31812.1 3-hydroxyisobutyryl-CoA hydrolase [Vandammella animalimorsus]PAT35429.1 3-hydroxyisobutyryl-CoA hydrolase [Vandammella animalimorsus]PAX17948.1 3-hydroxyisobutyryl-CoA hydrolase [Vandammella animalimorsus]PAX20102.1 3-hydroxyisobutyryl-CoA hydrolase [Vandammella animalimorsus]
MSDSPEILTEVRGKTGFITLNRPKALNALSLGMVRELARVLQAWRDDPAVLAIAIRGNGREGPFGAFCAGGDIRFLHRAGSDGNPQLEDFFTEEYQLNHLTHHLGKPYIAFMDGIVMGGGMGISQGADLRIVTERTKMAMPETGIGLFPDVGGGYFLSRAPGHVGEYLALVGNVIGAGDALAFGLADGFMPSEKLAALWDGLAGDFADSQAVSDYVRQQFAAAPESPASAQREAIDRIFGLGSVKAIIEALEGGAHADGQATWAAETAQTLRKRSPLMLHVVLEQIRRGRQLSLADDLRMERDLVRHCFYLRDERQKNSETIEGIRALAVDKDHQPQWKPARIEEVDEREVAAFFDSPWPTAAHPLAALD